MQNIVTICNVSNFHGSIMFLDASDVEMEVDIPIPLLPFITAMTLSYIQAGKRIISRLFLWLLPTWWWWINWHINIIIYDVLGIFQLFSQASAAIIFHLFYFLFGSICTFNIILIGRLILDASPWYKSVSITIFPSAFLCSSYVTKFWSKCFDYVNLCISVSCAIGDVKFGPALLELPTWSRNAFSFTICITIAVVSYCIASNSHGCVLNFNDEFPFSARATVGNQISNVQGNVVLLCIPSSDPCCYVLKEVWYSISVFQAQQWLSILELYHCMSFCVSICVCVCVCVCWLLIS